MVDQAMVSVVHPSLPLQVMALDSEDYPLLLADPRYTATLDLLSQLEAMA